MRTPGPLVHSPDYALAFRTLEPRPASARRLLVLLHGVGADESQLAAAGAEVDDDTEVILPRAPRTVGGDRYGWFRVSFPADGPRIVADEAEEARLRLIEFVEQLQQHHGVPASRTVLGGFSQGGVLSASVALSAPQRVTGFAVLAGRILPELEPVIAPPASLAGLRALIVHGRDDQTLPLAWAQRAAQQLDGLHVAHALKLHAGGHELSSAMQRDFIDWFGTGAQPWNG
jgi:phospholipase/carboxylesterase